MGGWGRISSTSRAAVKLIAVAEDRLEFTFYESSYVGRLSASLAFDRNNSVAITGFNLSSGSERGIVFEHLMSSF